MNAAWEIGKLSYERIYHAIEDVTELRRRWRKMHRDGLGQAFHPSTKPKAIKLIADCIHNCDSADAFAKSNKKVNEAADLVFDFITKYADKEFKESFDRLPDYIQARLHREFRKIIRNQAKREADFRREFPEEKF